MKRVMQAWKRRASREHVSQSNKHVHAACSMSVRIVWLENRSTTKHASPSKRALLWGPLLSEADGAIFAPCQNGDLLAILDHCLGGTHARDMGRHVQVRK